MDLPRHCVSGQAHRLSIQTVDLKQIFEEIYMHISCTWHISTYVGQNCKGQICMKLMVHTNNTYMFASAFCHE